MKFIDQWVDITGGDYTDATFDGCVVELRRDPSGVTNITKANFKCCDFIGDGWRDIDYDMPEFFGSLPAGQYRLRRWPSFQALFVYCQPKADRASIG